MATWAAFALAPDAVLVSSAFNAPAFASVALVLCGFLLLLARQTTTAVTTTDPALPAPADLDSETREQLPDYDDIYAEWHALSNQSLSPGLLLVNVALTQGLFLAVLVGAAVLAGVPRSALGVDASGLSTLALAIGVGLGIVLYVANQVGASMTDRLGLAANDELRSSLAPESARGWAILLLGVLPTVALFEEVMFRAALVGVLAVGFGISPWLLAVGSSLVFALGHGVQGPAGIVVTGTLGFVLAAAFILTESLLAVVVAHYLVNALEFVVHEWLGVEWT
ncbi:CPBP family intramembrane glutamic endopeptidase [Haloarchaeobius sp. DFWS5]|uniref:CPBP family intramembrane glutamic endopeptidase n=1 Tax=Haloarchaeobius sp. DFWS5 TaxID=3446114 RepID=UPI003EBF1ADC